MENGMDGMERNGHPLEAIDRDKGYQSCQSGFNFWRRKNRFTSEPQPGDIVVDEDGVFGSGTVTAIKAFQQKKNLGVDGIVGPATFAALDINDV